MLKKVIMLMFFLILAGSFVYAGSNQINLTNSVEETPTKNSIDSQGKKIIFWTYNNGAANDDVDYAMGLEPNGIWTSLPDLADGTFYKKWYAGTTKIMEVSTQGKLMLGGATAEGIVNINQLGTWTQLGLYRDGVTNFAHNRIYIDSLNDMYLENGTGGSNISFGPNSRFKFNANRSSQTTLYIEDQKVGINTTTPSEALVIGGSVSVSGQIVQQGGVLKSVFPTASPDWVLVSCDAFIDESGNPNTNGWKKSTDNGVTFSNVSNSDVQSLTQVVSGISKTQYQTLTGQYVLGGRDIFNLAVQARKTYQLPTGITMVKVKLKIYLIESWDTRAFNIRVGNESGDTLVFREIYSFTSVNGYGTKNQIYGPIDSASRWSAAKVLEVEFNYPVSSLPSSNLLTLRCAAVDGFETASQESWGMSNVEIYGR